MAKHAILSPSSASRWIACTPSARLEAQQPDTQSEFAAEGTLAHALGEALIRRDLGELSKTAFNKEIKHIEADPLFQPEMMGYAEDYATYVAERYAAAKAISAHAMIKVETRLDMTRWVPEGFGTADILIGAERVLDFIDLKYGKGVQVYAENNKQLMLYALGALEALDIIYDFDLIRMTIYQPRLDHVSTWEISRDELLHWAENELKPAAEKAWKGEGEFVVGSHCQFCRIRAICRAQHDYQMEMARHDFQAPVLLEDSEVSEVLKRKKDFQGWLKEVEDYAMTQAIHNGKKWPGMKLVEGQSVRIYADDKAVADKLLSEGYPAEKIYKPQSLVGITEMERLVTKKIFPVLLEGLVIKPTGKPTLVSTEDPRPELNSVEKVTEDFNDGFTESK